VGQVDSTLQVALVEPLSSGRIDELGFVVKKDIQLVVADPALVQKAIEKFYPEENESFTDILKELGSDTEIAKEVSEAAVTDDATMMARLARPRSSASSTWSVPGRPGPCQRHSLRTVRDRVQNPLPGGRRPLRNAAAPQTPGFAGGFPHQSHGQPEHLGAPPASGRAHQLPDGQSHH
jgi:hypothetical protein